MKRNGALLYDCFEKKTDDVLFGVIREDLDTFRDRTYPVFYIDLCGDFSFFSGFQTA